MPLLIIIRYAVFELKIIIVKIKCYIYKVKFIINVIVIKSIKLFIIWKLFLIITMPVKSHLVIWK